MKNKKRNNNMARRQNHKLTEQATQKLDDVFTLPEQITAPIGGLEKDGQDFVNALLLSYRFGHDIFDTPTPHHEDWIMLFAILTNEAAGRATVTKNIVEITGRTYGTVRSSLHRFEELGYIEPNQRIGRSELYVPTDKMKKTVNEFARNFWDRLAQSRRARSRAKNPA
jgi:DNA-binding MarR family transcriptional regulator